MSLRHGVRRAPVAQMLMVRDARKEYFVDWSQRFRVVADIESFAPSLAIVGAIYEALEANRFDGSWIEINSSANSHEAHPRRSKASQKVPCD